MVISELLQTSETIDDNARTAGLQTAMLRLKRPKTNERKFG